MLCSENLALAVPSKLLAQQAHRNSDTDISSNVISRLCEEACYPSLIHRALIFLRTETSESLVL